MSLAEWCREQLRRGREQKLERLVDVDDRGALMLQDKPDVASRDLDARRAHHRALACVPRRMEMRSSASRIRNASRNVGRGNVERLAQLALDGEVVALLQFTSDDAAPDFIGHQL